LSEKGWQYIIIPGGNIHDSEKGNFSQQADEVSQWKLFILMALQMRVRVCKIDQVNKNHEIPRLLLGISSTE